MREIRQSGSVEGAAGNRGPYSDPALVQHRPVRFSLDPSEIGERQRRPRVTGTERRKRQEWRNLEAFSVAAKGTRRNADV
jgi:hypothetical protein